VCARLYHVTGGGTAQSRYPVQNRTVGSGRKEPTVWRRLALLGAKMGVEEDRPMTVHVMVLPQQGVARIRDGVVEHRSEFPADEHAHLGHLARLAPMVEREARSDPRVVVVTSGGPTSADVAGRSEAEGFAAFCRHTGRWPAAPMVLDDLSLASGEQVLLPLIAARAYLDGLLADARGGGSKTRLSDLRDGPARSRRPAISRVTVLGCWGQKALRFWMAAAALRLPRFRYRHCLGPEKAAAATAAVAGEAALVAHAVAECNALLTCASCQAKRALRLSRGELGGSVGRILDHLYPYCPAVMQGLEGLVRTPRSTVAMDALRVAVAEELLLVPAQER
jgi:hypothetical protein